MLGTYNRRYALTAVALLVVALVTGTLALHHNSTKPAAADAAASGSWKHTASNKVQPNSPAVGSMSDADTQANAASKTRPITDACTLLTFSAAKKIVGAGAHAVDASNVSPLQTSGTSITTCAYTGQHGDVQLVIRKPIGRLGASENALVFGSGRPASAATVQGYGQAAYWDPGEHTLNVLGDNSFYVITRSTSTQADTEAVAKLLARGF